MRTCSLCHRPTGDDAETRCAACEQTLAFIHEAHRINGDDRILPDPDPAPREARLKKYEELAKLSQPLTTRKDRTSNRKDE